MNQLKSIVTKDALLHKPELSVAFPSPLIGMDCKTIRFKNSNGFELRIIVEYCPPWISMNETQFVVPQKKTCTIHFTVNEEINYTENNVLILSFRENFARKSIPLLSSDLRFCAMCRTVYKPNDNPSGFCVHPGDWHSSSQQCNLLQCSTNVGLYNLRSAHWTCCWSCDPIGTCIKSGAHSEKIYYYAFLRFLPELQQPTVNKLIHSGNHMVLFYLYLYLFTHQF